MTRQSSHTIAVVVPSFKRPIALKQCLDSLDRQLLLPEEVVVVYRTDDIETRTMLEGWTNVTANYRKCIVGVTVPGLIYALHVGTQQCSSDIVAYTDDDAIPHRDWLLNLLGHYDNLNIGGVGGRDIIPNQPATEPVVVGKLTWCGKIIGNHHLGVGSPRLVNILKGVNMSYRRELIRFPIGFKGTGSQPYGEVYTGLVVQNEGFYLLYDPNCQVDHFPAVRPGEDRIRPSKQAVFESSYNLNATMFLLLPFPKKLARIGYQLFLGDRALPGIMRLLVALLRHETDVYERWLPSLFGLWDALFDRTNIERRAFDKYEKFS